MYGTKKSPNVSSYGMKLGTYDPEGGQQMLSEEWFQKSPQQSEGAVVVLHPRQFNDCPAKIKKYF